MTFLDLSHITFADAICHRNISADLPCKEANQCQFHWRFKLNINIAKTSFEKYTNFMTSPVWIPEECEKILFRLVECNFKWDNRGIFARHQERNYDCLSLSQCEENLSSRSRFSNISNIGIVANFVFPYRAICIFLFFFNCTMWF